MTVTACLYLLNAMSISFCHVLLFHGSNTRICFDVTAILRDLSYRIYPPRKYSEGVHCTAHFTVLCTVIFLRCHKMYKINTIFHTISNSLKCFLTKDENSIVGCNTRMTIHCVWELCCRGPVSSIKHLGGVQYFSITIAIASSDN